MTTTIIWARILGLLLPVLAVYLGLSLAKHLKSQRAMQAATPAAAAAKKATGVSGLRGTVARARPVMGGGNRRAALGYAMGTSSKLFPLALLGLLMGSAILGSHNIWMKSWPGLIALTGLMSLLGGLGGLFLPMRRGTPKISPTLVLTALILTLLVGVIFLIKGFFGGYC